MSQRPKPCPPVRLSAALCLCLVYCVLASAPSSASGSLQFDVIDTASGRTLPSWRHGGRVYLAGEPGARYLLRIRNPTARRLLAVISVDGVNVLSGETAAYPQRGYVIDAGASSDIDGWRKNLRETAAFYFTALPDSYAARTGRAADVGVIGLAVFEEREPPVPSAPALSAAPAPGKRAAERPAGQQADRAAARDESRLSAAPRLGTGHGERLHSVATTTTFQRASSTPSQVVTVYYDRLSALIARGIVPPPAMAEPQPFPLQFVPDPSG